MLTITGNNFWSIEVHINGQTYEFSDMEHTRSAIYMYEQLRDRKDITYGVYRETDYIAFFTDSTVLISYKGEEIRLLYNYEEARKEIIQDLQNQVEKVIYKNYSHIAKCKDERRKDIFRKHSLIKGFYEKLMYLE